MLFALLYKLLQKILTNAVESKLYIFSKMDLIKVVAGFWLIISNQTSAEMQNILEAVEKPFAELGLIMNTYWREIAHSRDMIVVIYTDLDSINGMNTSLISRDIHFPVGKPTRVYNYIQFHDVFSSSWMPENLLTSDIIMFADNMPKGDIVKTPYIKYEHCFVMLVAPAGTRLEFTIVCNGMLLLEDRNSVTVIDVQTYKTCSLISATKKLHPKKDLTKTNGLTNIRRRPKSKMEGKCVIEMILEFALYRYGKVGMESEEIKQFPVFSILSMISSFRNITLLPVFKNYQGKFLFNARTHLLFMDSNFVFQSEPQEALIHMGMEDIVWLIINVSDPIVNLSTILKTIATMCCIVGLLLLFGCLLNHFSGQKYPFVRVLLLMWSIFLSVSIPRQPQKKVLRMFFLAWTVSASFLMMSYYLKSFNFLAFPSISRVKTQEELLTSDVPILVLSLGYANVAFKKDVTNVDYTDMRPFEIHFSRLKEKAGQISYIQKVSHIVQSKEQYALLLDYHHAVKILSIFPNISYYFLADRVATYPLFVHGVRADNYVEFLRKKVSHLKATGIISKLFKSEKLQSKVKSSVTGIPIKYMLNAYILMGICYFISCVVFFGEVVIYLCIDARGPQFVKSHITREK